MITQFNVCLIRKTHLIRKSYFTYLTLEIENQGWNACATRKAFNNYNLILFFKSKNMHPDLIIVGIEVNEIIAGYLFWSFDV